VDKEKRGVFPPERGRDGCRHEAKETHVTIWREAESSRRSPTKQSPSYAPNAKTTPVEGQTFRQRYRHKRNKNLNCFLRSIAGEKGVWGENGVGGFFPPERQSEGQGNEAKDPHAMIWCRAENKRRTPTCQSEAAVVAIEGIPRARKSERWKLFGDLHVSMPERLTFRTSSR
jgi:hypothetical protein